MYNPLKSIGLFCGIFDSAEAFTDSGTYTVSIEWWWLVESWFVIHWPDTVHHLRKSTFTRNPPLVTIQIKTTIVQFANTCVTSWQHIPVHLPLSGRQSYKPPAEIDGCCHHKMFSQARNKTKLRDWTLQNFLHSRIHKDPTLEKGDASRTEIVWLQRFACKLPPDWTAELNRIAQKLCSELEIWQLADPSR